MKPPFLEVVRSTVGLLRGQRFAIGAGARIGHGGDNDVRFDTDWSPSLALHHAVIERHAGTWRIRDLGTKAGTEVNGSNVYVATLQGGDEVRIANAVFTFCTEERPVVAGVVRVGKWLGFNPWSGAELYALRADDATDDDDEGGTCTLCLGYDPATDAPGFPALRERLPEGGVVSSCAGVTLAEWSRVADAQGAHEAARATLALALDAAHATMEGAHVRPAMERRVSFAGALINLAWKVPLRDEDWWQRHMHFTAGQLGVQDDVMGLFRRPRSDARFANAPEGLFDALEAAAAGSPKDVVRTLERMLADAGGRPSTEELRGAMRGLFPDRVRDDELLREQVAVLGPEGLART